MVDALTGPNIVNTWDFVASGQGTLNGGSGGGGFDFNGIENLTGGTLADTFNVDVDHTGDLAGAAGADIFNISTNGTVLTGNVRGNADSDQIVFSNDAFIMGMVDGGSGSDILDWQISTLVINFTSNGPGTLNGFRGDLPLAITVLGDGFDNINAFAGSGLGSTFTGSNLPTVYTINNVDSFTVSENGGAATPFVGFGSIVGGTSIDQFIFSGGTLSGTIDGGSQLTFENILTADNLAANTWTLGVSGAGSVDPVPGGFININQLVGGAGVGDTFNFTNAAATFTSIDGGAGVGVNDLNYSGVAGPIMVNLQTSSASLVTAFTNINSVTGSASSDTLFGANDVNVWNLTGAGTGTVDGFAFSAIENLTGGSAADTFNFIGAPDFASLNAGAGTDILNYAAATGPINVNLGTNSATFVGAGQATNFEQVVGSSATNDTLVGADDVNNWNLTGAGTGTVDGFIFSAIENLAGGLAADTFNFIGAPTFAGLDAGAGTDILNYAAATGPINVNLGTNSATFVGAGQATNFEQVVGSSNTNDTLVGANDANNWNLTGAESGTVDGFIFSAIENLTGGSANDAFTFAGGTLSGGLDGGAGTDTLTADNLSNVWTITSATGGTVTGLGGAFTNIDSVIGGPVDDQFTLAGASVFAGSINGASGSNTIFGGDVTNNWNLTGVNQGNIDGNSAFTNVAQLIGGSVADTFNFIGAPAFASLNAAAGTDILNYAAATGPITVNLVTNSATFIGAGQATNFEQVVGSGGANDTLIGLNDPNNWTLTGAGTGTVDGFSFSNIENLTGGSDVDTFNVNAPGQVTGNLNGGAGIDTLHQTFASNWVVNATNGGTTNGALGTFANIENLTAVGTTATLDMDGASITGTYTATAVSLDADGASFTGGTVVNIAGNLVASENQTIDTGNAAFSVSGTLTGNGTAGYTINTGIGSVNIGGATNANALSVTSSDIIAGEGVTTVGAQTYVGPVTVVGAVSGGILTFSGGGGAVNVSGPISGTTLSVSSGGANLSGAVTTTGAQSYSGGPTTFGGNLTGSNMTFNGPSTFNADHLLQSSTNVWDFNAPVTGSGNLDIIPTATTDIFIGNGNGPGNIASNQFGGFQGHLIIGAQLNPLDSPAEEAVVVIPPGVTADLITVDDNFLVDGDVTLIGSNIELNAGISAAPGVGQVTLVAVGDSQSNGGAGPGDITGPTGGTAVIGGGRAVLIANNGVANAGNIRLELGGGDLLLGISGSQAEPSFDPSSNATSVDFDPTTIAIIASLGLNLQSVQVVFTNPASALTGLQNVQFIDVGLFEEELSVFGVIGNGIAMSLDQCEEAEGCAPDISEEEIEALIAQIEGRISEIERRLASGDINREEGQRLLAGFQAELKNYQTYQQQLAEFIESQQEFGDDFGELDDFAEEFDEAEPAATDDTDGSDATEVEAPQFAAPEPEPEVEPAEEAFEELEDEFTEEEIPVDEFEDLDEDLEEDVPGLDGVPESAPDEFEDLDDELDEFEELATAIDPALIMRLTQHGYVNQYYGAVGIGANGRVVWTGDIVLPSFARQY